MIICNHNIVESLHIQQIKIMNRSYSCMYLFTYYRFFLSCIGRHHPVDFTCNIKVEMKLLLDGVSDGFLFSSFSSSFFFILDPDVDLIQCFLSNS